MRLACEQLVHNTLAPTAKDMQQEVQKQDSAEANWKALVKAASSPMSFPNKQLTAYALFDGSRRDKPAGAGAHLLERLEHFVLLWFQFLSVGLP